MDTDKLWLTQRVKEFYREFIRMPGVFTDLYSADFYHLANHHFTYDKTTNPVKLSVDDCFIIDSNEHVDIVCENNTSKFFEDKVDRDIISELFDSPDVDINDEYRPIRSYR